MISYVFDCVSKVLFEGIKRRIKLKLILTLKLSCKKFFRSENLLEKSSMENLMKNINVIATLAGKVEQIIRLTTR